MATPYSQWPTCGTIISEAFDDYSNELNNILNTPNITPEKINEKKKKLLASIYEVHGIKKICCKTRIIGSRYNYKIIK